MTVTCTANTSDENPPEVTVVAFRNSFTDVTFDTAALCDPGPAVVCVNVIRSEYTPPEVVQCWIFTVASVPVNEKTCR